MAAARQCSRAARVAAPALCGLLATAALANAATPARAGSYRGALTGAHASIRISFRVSADGRTVKGIAISSLPLYCSGEGPPGTPTIVFAPAKVSSDGSFSSAGKDMLASGPLKGSVAARLTLTGVFAKGGGSAHGYVVTRFGGAASSCSGRSAYAARHA